MKWLGICMVMAGSTGLGLWYSILYVRRGKNLSACQKGISVLRGEIAYGRTPLPDALSQAAGRTGGCISAFFSKVSERLCEGDGGMREIWEDSLKEAVDVRELPAEDRMELSALGDMLGYLDAEMQLGALDLYLKKLERSIRDYESERTNRTRLYPVLGIMCGALICIPVM